MSGKEMEHCIIDRLRNLGYVARGSTPFVEMRTRFINHMISNLIYDLHT